MTVLVTGAGGQLGVEVVRAVRAAGGEVVGLGHAELDLTDAVAVRATLEQERPTLVVNAAAWTDVDGCEADPDRAHLVNAAAVGELADACADVGARLVHVSTDYVFDGRGIRGPDGRRRPYRPDDPVDPINVYGASKAAGEVLVRDASVPHLVVRTAWVSGAAGRNFVTTMLRLADEGRPVRVVDDQVGSPTFARDLAAGLLALAGAGATGTFHLANDGACSWFELARATFEDAGLEVELRPIPSSEFPRPAARPAWSVLDLEAAVAAGVPRPQPWRAGLRDLLVELGRR
ncbi:dTDP-4-dehydrorhamnose reductase [Nitriliruptoraceae bacterium ZYF776]|nr:dTDP-4-dehydrorhamnose reductase [Profundirhabdus halotolerans]